MRLVTGDCAARELQEGVNMDTCMLNFDGKLKVVAVLLQRHGGALWPAQDSGEGSLSWRT